MGFLSRRIRDDRGTVHGVYGTKYLPPEAHRHTIGEEVFRRVRARAAARVIRAVDKPRRVHRGARVLLGAGVRIAAVVSAIGLACVLLPVLLPLVPEDVAVLIVLGLIIGIVLTMFSGVGYPGQQRPEAVARGMLAEKRCGSCGYPIADVRVEEDGCTVCPECGAAWRLPRRPCPWCGYDLAGARVMQDGLVYCPACAETRRPEA